MKFSSWNVEKAVSYTNSCLTLFGIFGMCKIYRRRGSGANNVMDVDENPFRDDGREMELVFVGSPEGGIVWKYTARIWRLVSCSVCTKIVWIDLLESLEWVYVSSPSNVLAYSPGTPKLYALYGN